MITALKPQLNNVLMNIKYSYVILSFSYTVQFKVSKVAMWYPENEQI